MSVKVGLKQPNTVGLKAPISAELKSPFSVGLKSHCCFLRWYFKLTATRHQIKRIMEKEKSNGLQGIVSQALAILKEKKDEKLCNGYLYELKMAI